MIQRDVSTTDRALGDVTASEVTEPRPESWFFARRFVHTFDEGAPKSSVARLEGPVKPGSTAGMVRGGPSRGRDR